MWAVGAIDLAAVDADGCTEVHILAIHEIALVEEAGCFGIAAAHEQAGARDPIDLPNLGRHGIEAGLRRESHERFLPQLCERADHPAERELGEAVGIDDSRAGDGAAPGSVRSEEATGVDGAVRHDGVAVQQQHQLARDSRMPLLLPRAKPMFPLRGP